MYNWTSEDINKIEAFLEAKKRGFFVNGGEVTELYNKVFNANLKSTSCQTCIRTRVNSLEQEYDRFKEELKKQETESVNSTTNTEEITVTAKKVGRPKKSE